ncbi:MAG: hypothetical protein SO016_01550 [Lachnospiraceae bacterium]|nr:hypothetical protein [Robinsoniella sp.]MDY3765367.1 hypothetical protein [Lachnospiraceae bacterium]
MIWVLTGTGAFGFLFLFEYHKCLSVRKERRDKNPWFWVGTILLLCSFAMMGVQSGHSSGISFWAGLLVLAAGIVFYGAVLSVADNQGYTQDQMKIPVSRRGMYGWMRHPGVWSFLVCVLGYGMMFPRAIGGAMWFAFLNFIYTWFQDRYFFPVYLEGYEQYRKEVPYLFPKKPDTSDR